MEFEWDREKAGANLQKHGVSFIEAATAFGDSLSMLVPDPRHTLGEERFVLFGRSSSGRLLAVMHTDRGKAIRIISARRMTPREIRDYESGGE